MVLLEWLTRKVIIIAALVAIVLSAVAFTAMQDEAVSIEPVLEIAPVLEPEPALAPEPAQKLEPAPEPAPEIEPVIEVEPEPEPAPEPVIIEPIEIVPPPVVEIPEPPPEVPSVPDEIPKPPEQEIQERVDRFDAQPGTPVPKKRRSRRHDITDPFCRHDGDKRRPVEAFRGKVAKSGRGGV